MSEPYNQRDHAHCFVGQPGHERHLVCCICRKDNEARMTMKDAIAAAARAVNELSGCAVHHDAVRAAIAAFLRAWEPSGNVLHAGFGTADDKNEWRLEAMAAAAAEEIEKA